jgi:two-component system KDP operon response regulator KdpE
MKRHTVLVADDDPDIVKLFSRALSLEGYRVMEARDAFDALHLVMSKPPTVVVCDAHLPGGEGAWLPAMIRCKCPRTAVVLVTHAPRACPTAELCDGVIERLLKPVQRERLLKVVRIAVRWTSERAGAPN